MLAGGRIKSDIIKMTYLEIIVILRFNGIDVIEEIPMDHDLSSIA